MRLWYLEFLHSQPIRGWQDGGTGFSLCVACRYQVDEDPHQIRAFAPVLRRFVKSGAG